MVLAENPLADAFTVHITFAPAVGWLMDTMVLVVPALVVEGKPKFIVVVWVWTVPFTLASVTPWPAASVTVAEMVTMPPLQFAGLSDALTEIGPVAPGGDVDVVTGDDAVVAEGDVVVTGDVTAVLRGTAVVVTKNTTPPWPRQPNIERL